MCSFTCGFILHYLNLFQTQVECVEHNNNFYVILVMHLFMMSNISDNHENTQKDTILLFEVGQTLIQTIN